MTLNRIYREKNRLYTESAHHGEAPFREQTINRNGKEYRNWEPRRSKLAASIMKGMECALGESSKILYLGASHGYTVSFAADIAQKGAIYAIDFSPRVVRELVLLSERRTNIAPILADARKPETYYHYIEPCDILYQDVAQKDQAAIFMKNANLFLKKEGKAYLAIKARSIDTTKEPKKIFKQARDEIETTMKVLDYKVLEPYQKDHCMLLCTKK
ncbi:fibrillarin-like rRNA/tRNA 2'-O-methyltransferase [Candidatus Woesearchaeota archaeon]|nr:fibrillarin-like rRNA/tRNA 2'-O-methyltransferase [Candidatus Woesearchaeota archaeon]